MSQRTAIEELLARSAVYHGLSVILHRPDAQVFKWLAMQEHHRLPEIVTLLAKEAGGPLLKAVRRLVRGLDSVSAAEWVWAYGQLFGHSVHGPVPPYELEYGEEHEQRQPQQLGDIAAFYAAFGLSAATRAHERVDHAGTECEFLHYLLYKEAYAVETDAHEQAEVCRAAVQRFLADHLGRWGPAFALRLKRAVGEEVWGAVGDVLLEWLSQECVRMDVPLGSSDLPLRSPQGQEAVGCAACLPAAPDGALGCAVQAGVLQPGKPGDAC